MLTLFSIFYVTVWQFVYDIGFEGQLDLYDMIFRWCIIKRKKCNDRNNMYLDCTRSMEYQCYVPRMISVHLGIWCKECIGYLTRFQNSHNIKTISCFACYATTFFPII